MSSVLKWGAALLGVLSIIVVLVIVRRSAPPREPQNPEARIVAYLEDNVRPGQPVLVTDLLNNVFTTSEEQRVLERMFGRFFTIPAVAAQFRIQTGRLPTIQELTDQFAFTIDGEMEVFLRVMDADPRLPTLLRRDPQTGEIEHIELEAVAAVPRFSEALERATKQWKGEPEPPFSVSSFSGEEVNSASLKGMPHLLYFWFTGCVPCANTMPLLTNETERDPPERFRIIAANMDRVLELDRPGSDGSASIEATGLSMTPVHVTPEMARAYGDVMVYPNMFFVDGAGRVAAHLAGPQNAQAIEAAFESLKAPTAQLQTETPSP